MTYNTWKITSTSHTWPILLVFAFLSVYSIRNMDPRSPNIFNSVDFISPVEEFISDFLWCSKFGINVGSILNRLFTPCHQSVSFRQTTIGSDGSQRRRRNNRLWKQFPGTGPLPRTNILILTFCRYLKSSRPESNGMQYGSTSVQRL